MGGFQDILLEGLAQDGGLAMPAFLPKINREALL
ncbi:MAG: Threonine synthase terminus, partial [Pseudomonadota bacterium]